MAWIRLISGSIKAETRLSKGSRAAWIKDKSGSISDWNSPISGFRIPSKSCISGSKSCAIKSKIGVSASLISCNPSPRICPINSTICPSGSLITKSTSPSCSKIGARDSPSTSINGFKDSIKVLSKGIKASPKGTSSMFPRGSIRSSRERFSWSKVAFNPSIFWSFISSSDSDVAYAPSSISASCVTTSGPKSSHIVPNKATPAWLCARGSSISANAWIVWSKASLAESPPAANLAAISSAFNPIAEKPSCVVAEPSTTRIDISLMASPTLSKLKAPDSAPLSMIANISSASRPTFANCTEYSLILSSNSPEKSNPFWAPVAIKFMASSPLIPNWVIIALAARTDSFMSYPKVSRNVKADSVMFCKEAWSKSPICWVTADIASAISPNDSP